MKKFIAAPSKSYCEIYQDSDLKFAFAVEDAKSIRQVHDFVKCRDFFNEAVVASQVGCECPTTYRFTYPAKEYPVDLETTRLILKGDDFKLFKKNLPFLQDFENLVTALGPIPTTIIEQIPDTDLYYLKSSYRWTLSSVMISFYTHILRCLYQYDIDSGNLIDFLRKCADGTGNAANYQKTINKINFEVMLRETDKLFPNGTLPWRNMSEINSVDTLHNYGGIVSWSNSIIQKREDMSGMYPESVQAFLKMGGLES